MVSRVPATGNDGVPLAHVVQVLGPSVLRVLAGPGRPRARPDGDGAAGRDALGAREPVDQQRPGRASHYDRRQGTDYHATLATWLDSLGDVALAARALNVHRNTVRYRLQRIVEVCGVRLDDPEERLVAMLHLRVVGVWPRPQPLPRDEQ